MKLKLLFVGFALIALSALAGTTRFVAGTEDVPLMDGLTAVTEDHISFDTPEGRIVQSSAFTTSLSLKQVLSFYQETLPQLGWIQKKQNTFERETDELVIDAQKNKTTLFIHFNLQTKAK